MANKSREVKLTLADIIAKKQAKATQEVKVEDVYVTSLGGSITVTAPSKKIIYQYADRLNEAKESGAAEVFLANCFLISQCVSSFRDAEFCGGDIPEIAVHNLLEIDDINDLTTKINAMTGNDKSDKIAKDIKN